MPKYYSADFRRVVLDKIDAGMSQVDAATFFGITTQTIQNWIKLEKETGSLERKERKPYASKRFSDKALLDYINNNNDTILEDIANHFSVAIETIRKRLMKLNITRKKNHALHRAGRRKARSIQG